MCQCFQKTNPNSDSVSASSYVFYSQGRSALDRTKHAELTPGLAEVLSCRDRIARPQGSLSESRAGEFSSSHWNVRTLFGKSRYYRASVFPMLQTPSQLGNLAVLAVGDPLTAAWDLP